MVVIIIMVMIVFVPPFPILFLLVFVQLTKITMLVVMGFHRPLVVVNDFVVVPAMAVVIVGIAVIAAGSGPHPTVANGNAMAPAISNVPINFFLNCICISPFRHFSATILVALQHLTVAFGAK